MNESTLFIVVLCLFVGFGCGAGVIRKFKGTDKATLKLAVMVLVTAVFSVLQYYKYQSVVGTEIEYINIMKPLFFGSIAFGALLSCSVYRLVKNA
ncbi:hypothetical protein [Neptuniibacter caesariensis]|uniref:Uncharacterized protein n=1 Tax=Neptuniibacter caesariensis TaxID=207954 RepID=A0A7U8C4X1_NEPCE|nr:hypothetical protein [Neptuniibacter caesariensis]EAR61592.1 hypothetical protein MED92_13096 [Oceanospirillum sp. MED92] [Neptuniibacter caesariensis]